MTLGTARPVRRDSPGKPSEKKPKPVVSSVAVIDAINSADHI